MLWDRMPTVAEIREAIKSPGSRLVIAAPPRSGRTTLAKELATTYMAVDEHDLARIALCGGEPRTLRVDEPFVTVPKVGEALTGQMFAAIYADCIEYWPKNVKKNTRAKLWFIDSVLPRLLFSGHAVVFCERQKEQPDLYSYLVDRGWESWRVPIWHDGNPTIEGWTEEDIARVRVAAGASFDPNWMQLVPYFGKDGEF